METSVEIKKLKDIWKRVFGDDDEYISLFFSRKYPFSSLCSISENGEIASLLYIIPYDFKFFNSILNSGYLCGFATQEHYRGLSYGSTLLRENIALLHAVGVHLCTLIPSQKSLINYYSRFSFYPLFHKKKFHYKRDNCKIYNHLHRGFSNEVFNFYTSRFSARNIGVIHSKSDLEVVEAYLKIFDGDIFYIYNGSLSPLSVDSIVSVAFVMRQDDEFIISEIVSVDDESKNILVQSIMSHLELCGVDCMEDVSFSDSCSSECEYGMARVINAQAIIEAFAVNFRDVNTVFRLIDDIVTPNNGVYTVESGLCIKHEEHEGISYSQTIDITVLIPYIYSLSSDAGGVAPYIGLMLE